MKRNIYICFAFIFLTGCDSGCEKEIVQDVVALGSIKLVQKRISGQAFFDFSKQDSKDGFVAQNGFLCVTHNPGCGWWGNNGTDEFFGPSKPLPPLCTINTVEFTQFWPNGISSSSAGGNLFGTGSYGAGLHDGSTGGSVPFRVKWKNTCWEVFGGKDLFYVISFIVTVPEGVDIGEPVFDVTSTEPPCAPMGFSKQASEVTTMTAVAESGLEGSVRYCNITNSIANGTLHIEGKLVTPIAGAKGANTMSEDIPISFSPSGGGVPSVAGFKTKFVYQQGSWQFTKIQVTGLTGLLTGLPLTLNLPGALGTPIFDFTGNNQCNR